MLLNKIKETNALISAKYDSNLIMKELEEYSKAIDKLTSIKKTINNYSISIDKLNKIDTFEFRYDDVDKVRSTLFHEINLLYVLANIFYKASLPPNLDFPS